MDRGVAVALATAIGGGLALQAPLNSLLGRSVGSLTASVVAFGVGLAALAGAAFAWAVMTGIGLGTVFPICLAMCLDVAREPAEAGAAAALMFLAGYPIAALGPLGAGAIRDLTGDFDASLWALFGMAVVMALVLAPLTARRLRPANARGRV